MTTDEIRKIFLDHFAQNYGHKVAPSASLIPSSYDASVLLNVAGMQPFKPYFAGVEEPPAKRMVSCQKCFRTPDIDEVGLTARHMTFFEMLGNFSFGDYFKAGAIEMAWDLVINKLKLDPDKLWVTVHEGDPEMGLGPDEEARELWLKVGVPADRIVALGEDNFWKAGKTGPCGPCSEIFYDRGAEWGPDGQPGDEGDRYLEFYNLVFMQYTRDEQGVLTELPAKNIDTGMGLERISSIIQGNVSIFEIDSVAPIVAWAEHMSGKKYGSDDAVTKAMRVLVDHGRGMTFLASDGVTPANDGRGYVLRRIIRRAIEHADRIGLYKNTDEGSVLSALHNEVVQAFGSHYREVIEQKDIVSELLRSEEERFLRTLETGSELLKKALTELDAGATQLSGEVAFQLHDTYGFPIELTQEIADEQGKSVDRQRFSELMLEQKERARAAANTGSLPIDQAAKFAQKHAKTEFVGYQESNIDTEIIALERAGSSAKNSDDTDEKLILIKLERSPFYAEGGGQVSDSGTISGTNGLAEVVKVLRFDDDQVILAAVDGDFAIGDRVQAEVSNQRQATEANHTATHLLHAALQAVLGDHVRQAGSLVEPRRLRFDFTHPTAVTREELAQIEASVIEQIKAAKTVSIDTVGLETARERGAMMLFGEKYGDLVRMVSIGSDGMSVELCGGTHVENTGSIRDFLIVNESSVGGGTRRIEAITGDEASDWLRKRAQQADNIAQLINSDIDDLTTKVQDLLKENRRLEREQAALRSTGALDSALENQRIIGDVLFVTHRDDSLQGDELLTLSDKVRGKLGEKTVTVLAASSAADKVALVVTVGSEAQALGLHAGNIIKRAAQAVGGGGGGRPSMARAGGKNPKGINEAFATAEELIHETIAPK